MGKFLVALFATLFNRKMTESEVQSILSAKAIDTRWITELRENRKLFFHETPPWVAMQIYEQSDRSDPALLPRFDLLFCTPVISKFASQRRIHRDHPICGRG